MAKYTVQAAKDTRMPRQQAATAYYPVQTARGLSDAAPRRFYGRYLESQPYPAVEMRSDNEDMDEFQDLVALTRRIA